MLTKNDDILEVCSEETMNEILDRYIDLNEHSASYTWKRLGRPLDMEKTLEENDILFIDTSHVSKFESDVNYIFFQVLPRLKKGVIIHFHDIFYPFDYPIEWLEQGRAWNESYMLRSFLMYNPQFRILLFPSLLEQQYSEYMLKNFPMCMKTHATIEIEGIKRYLSILGQSIYIQKV